MERNLLDYKGTLTSEVRIQLLDLLKCIALYNLGPRKDLKKLIGIALELLDNAQRYNVNDDVDFRWFVHKGELVVTIRNYAQGDDARRLEAAVSSISNMTDEELGRAFREQLTNERFGEKGGAGLGFLQIARKVGRNISAEIEPSDGEFFLCTSRVSTQLITNDHGTAGDTRHSDHA